MNIPRLGTTSFDEISATLRVLENNGVTIEHFARIRSNKYLAKIVSQLIVGYKPSVIIESKSDWQEFYAKYFKLNVDFSNVVIPELKDDFTRVIIVAAGITATQILDKMSCNFKVHVSNDYRKYFYDNVITNDRENNLSYAIVVRNCDEADENLKEKSANDIFSQKIHGITLLERLLFDLKSHDEHGHLDSYYYTICSGSKFSNGEIPLVNYSYSHHFTLQGFKVDSKGPNHRVREVII